MAKKTCKKRGCKTVPRGHEYCAKHKPAETQALTRYNALAPVSDGGKYMMHKSFISENQVLKMLQRTPTQHVHQRPGKGGGQWDYVTGTYVKKVLNFVFGWNWDFEIVQHEIVNIEGGKGVGQVWVLGKLTVKNPDSSQAITKMQYGRADIKYKKGTKVAMDLGNDLKAASTDALKKCASELGIANDVYGKNEFRGLGVSVENGQQEYIPPKEERPPKKEESYECHSCGNPLTAEENKYSKNIYKKPLCQTCQQEADTTK